VDRKCALAYAAYDYADQLLIDQSLWRRSDIRDAIASHKQGRIAECLAARAQWLPCCVPEGGLEADSFGRTPLHYAAGMYTDHCVCVYVCV
jgi:hypothetical protein